MLWTAAEPSIAVVSACLPSLRPLFVRLVWGSAQRPKATAPSYPNNNGNHLPSANWRNGSRVHDRSFSRLPDDSSDVYRARKKKSEITVSGCREGRGKEDDLELGRMKEEEPETPVGRIRAKTTVILTISERVEWQDDLF